VGGRRFHSRGTSGTLRGVGQIDFYTVGPDEERLLDYATGDQGLVLFPGVATGPQPGPVGRACLPSPGT
jgi:hypothetical protein